jgi:DNA invertase Pin-like site-specific DNA recombinase
MQQKKYIADIYLRLSREDGDNDESNSITNQRAILLDFISRQPDIELHKIRIDDGFTGVNFDRPAFIEMFEDIKNGVVNTVIVRDLSRFSRNYIEGGKYIQMLFPRIGVRFIALGENYDSLKSDSSSSIIVPFKNIINDSYCADTSVKTRSSLEIKRKKGDFVGAFTVYGYKKSAENHNKLEKDIFAAEVVRDIFNLKLDGMSAQAIADKLNAEAVLSPLEYKKYCGLNFKTSFKVSFTAKWTAKAIFRILTNEIYIGILEQGKHTTPNYKIKKTVEVEKEKRARHEDFLEPIIEKAVFETVQNILKKDTRFSPTEGNIRPLSGVVFCGDCNASMFLKTTKNKYGTYHYYICSENRQNKSICSSHIIAVNALETAVLQIIQSYILTLSDMDKILDTIEKLPLQKDNVRKLNERISVLENEIFKYEDYKLSLFESYRDKIISKEDFLNYKANYSTKIETATNAKTALQAELDSILVGQIENNNWLKIFKKYAQADKLERRIVAELIEKIVVYDKTNIKVIFRYANEFERLNSALKGVK